MASSLYVITNPLFREYIKIGITGGTKKALDARLSQLNTSVPFDFEVLAWFVFEDDQRAFEVEQSLHKLLKPFNKRREFFTAPALRTAMDILKSIDAKDAKVSNINNAPLTKSKKGGFFDMGLKIGDIIRFKENLKIKAMVVGNHQIEPLSGDQKNFKMSLSAYTRILKGYKSVNGFLYWEDSTGRPLR